MSVTINSGVRASSSYETSLSTPPLILNSPDGTTGSAGGSIPISSVIGLQPALDGKLNDIISPVGPSNVYANGVDLNLLAGTNAYGLVNADFIKLADVTVTATEINYLTGVTGPIQTQIDAAYSGIDFTVADQMIVGTGASAGSIETIADVLGGTVGIGYEFADLKSPSTSLDYNGQYGINVLDPVNAQDVATKNYVDTAVLGGGAFLPLGGGTMAGAIDLGGNATILDAGGASTMSAAVDGVVVLDVSGNSYTWTALGFSVGGNGIHDLLDPVAAQDAVTKSYIDTSFLPLSGGVLSGPIDMDGNAIVLDTNGGTSISASVDDTIVIALGSGGVITLSTDIDAGGLDISNLPAVPASALSAITATYGDGAYLELDGTNAMSAALNLGGNNVVNLTDPTVGSEVGDRDYNDIRYLQSVNDLSDLSNAGIARTNLGLANIATTGDYNDLINQPSLIANMNDLGDVSTGIPGAIEDGYVVAWNDAGSAYNLVPPSVITVHGRTGAVAAVAGDYTAAQITNVPAGNIISVDAQTAINELDSNKLAIDGSINMTGNLDLGGNQIVNIGFPFTIGLHTFTAASYSSSLGGGSFWLSGSNTPSAAAPTYAFVSAIDTGMWLSGADISVSIGGTNALVIGSDISVENRQVKNVADPIDLGDAVNLAHIKGLGIQRVLGSITGVDLVALAAGTALPVYTIPAGGMHIISKIIVVTSSYVPGVSPNDPSISVGIAGANYDQIVDTTSLSWGVSGAGDQAVYIGPKQGAATPNAANTVSVQVVTPATGTFSALTVSIFVIGMEL